ncbi:MAG: hypothetical protein IKY74_03590 [Alistipes sp.]|nr:hypothetical protein [Alistipes sp.]
MKLKNLFFALLALPLVFVACEKGGDEQLDPTVKITVGTATETTLSFTVESTGADKVAYLVVEGEDAPTASEVLANGTTIDGNKSVAVTAEDLKGETLYTIVAAAQNPKATVKATQKMTTLSAIVTPNTPALNLKSAGEMSFAAEGGKGEIKYEIVNPVEGAKIYAEAGENWVANIADDGNGTISFDVLANEAEARQTKLFVNYGTEDGSVDLEFSVDIKQVASGETPPEHEFQFVATQIATSYENYEGLHIYYFEVGDKGWNSNGWGVDGGTYYAFEIVAATGANGVLPAGTYVLADDYSVNTISSNSYRYQIVNGEMANGFEMYVEANLIISDGKIEADLLMADGSIHYVVFEGDLSVEDGGTQGPTEFEATHVAEKWLWGGSTTWGNKYQVVGEGFSVDVHFLPSIASEETLAEGEYNWVNTTIFGSYEDEFTTRTLTVEGQSVAVDGGALSVSKEGDEYHIEMTLEGRDGFVYMIEYNGKLNDKGEEPGGNSDYVVNTLGEGVENTSYAFFTYKAEGDNFTFDLLVNNTDAKATSINPGSYMYSPMGKQLVGNPGYFYLDAFKVDGVKYTMQVNSSMVVEGDGNNVNITINAYANTGETFVVKYNGTVGGSSTGGGTTEVVKLTTPTLFGEVYGNAITVSWNEIVGAKDYTVTLNGTDVQTVSTAYIQYQNLAWETTYTVSVVANPADATVNSASDAGTATFTTEAAPADGGDEGGNTGEDYTNWNYSAFYDTNTAVVTLTGKDDSRVITVKTNELAFAKFYADATHSSYFTDVTVDGVPTTDVTAESYVHVQQTKVTIDLVINGVKYTGDSNGFSY